MRRPMGIPMRRPTGIPMGRPMGIPMGRPMGILSWNGTERFSGNELFHEAERNGLRGTDMFWNGTERCLV